MDSWPEQIPISWIEHHAYCARQWALIALEGVFDDDEATTRGNLLHRKVDEAGSTVTGGLRSERSLPLWSDALGVVGKADIVEFVGEDLWPVEFKAGASSTPSQRLQVVAQAMCLEEMFGRAVPVAYIYLAGVRQREEVVVTDDLRAEVRGTVAAVRAQLATLHMPHPHDDRRCARCSLWDRCLPTVAFHRRRVSALHASGSAV